MNRQYSNEYSNGHHYINFKQIQTKILTKPGLTGPTGRE
jgi:hypothetical protein